VAHSAAAPAMAATADRGMTATAATVTATTAATAASAAPVTCERAAGRAQSNYDCTDAYGQSQCGNVLIKQTHGT
jgi:hypothetical protein